MSVGRICSRVVVTARPDESVRDAAVRMGRQGVGTLVVVDEEARPIGIVTDRDVAIRCVGGHLDLDVTEVADVMTAPVRGVPEDTPIEDALARMAAAATRRLVVVDARDRLAGLLAMDDVLDLLAEEASDIGRLLGGQSGATRRA
ncbi:MAG TPA: CBS domain-containing protein [Gemmatimonadota bacterium]|nr:CBS domain-containing protein [Gemmatimonadota bacterium]